MANKKHLKILLLFSFLSGVTLLFGLFTDYSWKSLTADLAYPFFTGLVGIITWTKIKEFPDSEKRINKMLCLPAIIGGSLITFLMILMLFPPNILATLFWGAEQNDAIQIQSVISPNQQKTAEVIFLPVGAYSPGSGRIEIKINYRWLPFIHRDFYHLPVSHAHEETENYIEWVDDNHISISETGEIVEVGNINFELPILFFIPVAFFR